MIVYRFDEEGRYTSEITTTIEGLIHENHSRVYTGPVDMKNEYHDLIAGTPVRKPLQPSQNHVFDYATKQWKDPRTIEDLKSSKRAEIKQDRTQAEYLGFTWSSYVFDSDAVSQSRINGAVTLAMIAIQAAVPYEVVWTLADDSRLTLSSQELLLVGLALGQHVQANFNKGQLLQTQIDAALTKEEVEAIVW